MDCNPGNHPVMNTNPEPLGEFTRRGEVRFVRRLPGPIERVWEFLTDSEKRGRWLAAGRMETRAGGTVELKFRHSELTPHAETVPEKYREMCASDSGACDFTGRVLRCEPPRLLSFTWGEADGSESEVTFELTPEGDGVRLVLTHRRLGDDRGVLTSVAAGWHTHLAILAAKLAGAEPPPFWATHTRAEAEYEPRVDAARAADVARS